MIARSRKFPWVLQNQQQVADFFERSLQAIGQWRCRGMPGKSGAYDLRAILKWAIAEGLIVPIAIPQQSEDGGLNRQRQIKADLLEMELQQRKSELVSRIELRNGLGLLAVMIRQMSDRLKNRYGPDAAMSVNEMLDDYHRVITHEFGADCLPGESTAGSNVVPGSSQGEADSADQPVGRRGARAAKRSIQGRKV